MLGGFYLLLWPCHCYKLSHSSPALPFTTISLYTISQENLLGPMMMSILQPFLSFYRPTNKLIIKKIRD